MYYLENKDSKVYSKGKEIWLKDALSRDESSKAHSKEKTDRAQRRR